MYMRCVSPNIHFSLLTLSTTFTDSAEIQTHKAGYCGMMHPRDFNTDDLKQDQNSILKHAEGL